MSEYSKKQSVLPILFGSYYCMLFYGTYYMLLGFLLPQIKADFNVSYTESGIIFLLPIIPGVLGNIFAGYILSRFNKKVIIICGCSILIVFYLLLPLSWLYIQFIIFNLLLCSGISLMQKSVSVSIAEVFAYKYPQFRDNGITIFHFAFTTGSIIALILGNILIINKANWRLIFILDALAASPILVSFIVSRYPGVMQKKKEGQFSTTHNFISMLSNKKLLLYSFSISLYVGTENSIGNWTSSFLENGYHYDKSYSSLILLLFLSMITAGRLIGIFTIHKLNQFTIASLFILFAATALTLEIFFRITFFGIDIFIHLCGLFLSILYPSIQNLMIKDFQHNISAATGVFFAASAIGSTFLPFLTGVINDLVGIKYGFIAAVIYLLIILPLLGLTQKNV